MVSNFGLGKAKIPTASVLVWSHKKGFQLANLGPSLFNKLIHKRLKRFIITCQPNAIGFYIRAKFQDMYWTLELANYLVDAPWPATKDELIDYAIRSGAPLELIENLQELEDDGDAFETIDEIWPDFPTQDEYYFDEDEL